MSPKYSVIKSGMVTTLNKNDVKIPTALDVISKHNDPFQVLISTILSARTRDENTMKASMNLFSKYPNAESLSNAKVSSVKQLIKPAGFYNVKSKRIIAVSKIIKNQYAGNVPDDFEELIRLPSVGRKTANCVLVYGFGKPAIPVDTHVHRISNRIGIVTTNTPDETEIHLSKILNKKNWLEINPLFVQFGQNICKPISPSCNKCELNSICHYAKNNT